MNFRILRVALDVPLPRLFDYTVDAVTQEDVGRCIRVPFGNGEKIGVIVALADTSEHAKLKQAGEILRALPALPADWLALTEFCSRYYQHPLGEVMALALPPQLRRGKLPAVRKAKPIPVIEQAAPQLPELLPEQASAVAAVAADFGRYAAYL